jgi:hypothetical protein
MEFVKDFWNCIHYSLFETQSNSQNPDAMILLFSGQVSLNICCMSCSMDSQVAVFTACRQSVRAEVRSARDGLVDG